MMLMTNKKERRYKRPKKTESKMTKMIMMHNSS